MSRGIRRSLKANREIEARMTDRVCGPAASHAFHGPLSEIFSAGWFDSQGA